ncbi:hypothetical protein Cus16_3129 [Curtobacterium sp. ER1/6]|nr:hypothetical protein Cus16_3129 [Curtobacterium sp. ER1/6]
MVHVDVGVPGRPHAQVDQRVLAEGGQHVVEERHARRDVGRTGAVQIERQLDARLARAPADRGGAGGHASTLTGGCAADTRRMASRNAVVSSSVPALTRRWFGMPRSRTMTSCSRSASNAAFGSATPPKSTKFDHVS